MAQAETSQEFSFQIRCEWNHELRLDEKSPGPEAPNGPGYLSAEKPFLVQQDHLSTVLEIAGAAGTRHFMMPDIGGPLAGMMITVYPEGQSIGLQQYRVQGKVYAHATKGSCEVIE